MGTQTSRKWKRWMTCLLTMAIIVTGIGWSPKRVEAAKYPTIKLVDDPEKFPWLPMTQKNGCGLTATAMVESYYMGLDRTHHQEVYNAVSKKAVSYWKKGLYAGEIGYRSISCSLDAVYKQLQAGHPVLIYRGESIHWAVIIGYTGSSSKLEKSGFIVLNDYPDANYSINAKYDASRAVKNLESWLNGCSWKWAWVRDKGVLSGKTNIVDKTQVNLTGVTSITQTSARINANLVPGATIQKAGFCLGTAPDKMNTTKEENSGNYTESIWYDLGTGKWTSALKSNTTYYYQIYAVINGTEYRSIVDSFTTKADKNDAPATSVKNTGVTDTTETSARINAKLSPGTAIDKAGFYLGTSADKMNTTKEENVGYQVESIWYDLGTGKWTSALKAGTKYYYQIYVVIDGVTYKGEVDSFTTNSAKSDTVPLKSIALLDTEKVITKGESFKLAVSYNPTNTTDSKKVKWTSSDSKIATVSDGTVTAVSAGTATITAEVSGKKATCKVTVQNPSIPLYSISLSEIEKILEVGESLKLAVNYDPYNTTDSKKVVWTSSDKKVATVSDGTVKAVAAGTATITADVSGKQATCTITVPVQKVKISGLTLNKTSITLTQKESELLTVTATPENATDKKVIWSSNNKSVATVDVNGNVTAYSVGTAKITATAEDGSGVSVSCNVTVTAPEKEKPKIVKVDSIALDSENIDLEVGNFVNLFAAVAPADASNKTLSWSSSNIAVATVDDFGKVTAWNRGNALIMASASDGSEVTAVCVVSVTDTAMASSSETGWKYTDAGVFYNDPITGNRVKGTVKIDDKNYYFDLDTGFLVSQIDGWRIEDGKEYWYENNIRQGYDPDDKEYRGKEVYDLDTDSWYWLDNVQQGAKAVSKDVYQESLAGEWGDSVNEKGQKIGKWVRYDENGHMVKGWQTTDDGTYYFDKTYGTMAKGTVSIDGQPYSFDPNSGILLSKIDGWKTEDGKKYWYENGVRQGYDPNHPDYRGKEIFDPDSNAWYWLDNVQQGAMAVSKDVYQESLAGPWGDLDNGDGTRSGKWVRYDENGHMVKGWQTTSAGTFYFDETYGTMAKGNATIGGVEYYFDPQTGILQ